METGLTSPANVDAEQSHLGSLAATILPGVVGAGMFLAMPVIVTALTAGGMSDSGVGTFSSVQLASVAAGCLASLWLGPRLDARRVALLAVVVLLAADLVSAWVSAYPLFLTVRALGGLAGGLAISITTATLARMRSADRNFGWFLLCQILFQMLATWQLPRVLGEFGIRGVFLVFVTVEGLAFLLIARHFPHFSGVSARTATGRNTPRVWLFCALVLTSILCFFIAVGSFWTFIGRIGEQNVGLPAAVVGSGLSLAAFGGLAGAFLPALLGARFGRALPITVAAGALMAGVQLMMRAGNQLEFVTAAAVFSFGWFLIYPYQLGVLASLDEDGRPLIASAALTGAGLGIGPTLVVSLLPARGLAASFSVALASVAVSAACVLFVLLVSRSSTPRVRSV